MATDSRPSEPRPGFTAVGRVLRPHGLRGELRIEPFSSTARNIQRGRPVYLQGARHAIEGARYDHGAWILKLGGIDDRTTAESARGQLLETPDAEVLRDDDESYFVHELVGLRVETNTGDELGMIIEVMTTGANDVWVVRGPEGDILVPAIAEVIDHVDVAGGLVIITPLMGLLDKSK